MANTIPVASIDELIAAQERQAQLASLYLKCQWHIKTNVTPEVLEARERYNLLWRKQGEFLERYFPRHHCG